MMMMMMTTAPFYRLGTYDVFFIQTGRYPNLFVKNEVNLTLRFSLFFWIKTLRNSRQPGSPQTLGAVLIPVARPFVVVARQFLFWIELKSLYLKWLDS